MKTYQVGHYLAQGHYKSFQPELINKKWRLDDMEVINLLGQACTLNIFLILISLLDDLPFSSRLIRETHSILLQGVRGEHKQPGNFRTSQNWIGGASINDATFIPPMQDINY